jgi:hypothetical protein
VRLLSTVDPARLHGGDADGTAPGEQVDAIEVVGGFLEPEAACLVVVPVPLAEVHPAVRYVVYGLDLVDRPQYARPHDLQHLREQGRMAQGERDGDLILPAPECLPQRPQLLRAYGDRFLQKEWQPNRGNPESHPGVQVASCPDYDAVVVCRVL